MSDAAKLAALKAKMDASRALYNQQVADAPPEIRKAMRGSLKRLWNDEDAYLAELESQGAEE